MLHAPTNRSHKHYKTALVVLGMHRSGTSALTHALSLLGAKLPENLMQPLAGNNPQGFWESLDVLAVNHALLQALDSDWDDWGKLSLDRLPSDKRTGLMHMARSAIQDNYSDAPLIVIKDPRICRIFPFWESTLTSMGYAVRPVLIARNPLEVASSLAARDSASLTNSIALWLRHVLDSEMDTRESKRVVVTYDQLLANPQRTLKRIGDTVSHPDSVGATWRLDKADSILSAEHQHQRNDQDDLAQTGATRQWALDAYLALTALAAADNEPAALRALDTIRSQFDTASTLFSPLRDESEQNSKSARAHHAAITDGLARLQKLHGSALRLGNRQKKAAQRLVSTTNNLANDTRDLHRQTRAVQALIAALNRKQRRIDEATNALRNLPAAVSIKASLLTRHRALLYVTYRVLRDVNHADWIQTARLAIRIARDDLFDPSWYLAQYEGIRPTYAAAVAHWLVFGWIEGLSPCPEFDLASYQKQNPDVEADGQNPLLHYLDHGASEGRSCSVYFQADWYACENPDVARSRALPFTHYRQHGRYEGRPPNHAFDPRFYQLQRPKVPLHACLGDYVLSGSRNGLRPISWFDPDRYELRYPIDTRSGSDPLAHYLCMPTDQSTSTCTEHKTSTSRCQSIVRPEHRLRNARLGSGPVEPAAPQPSQTGELSGLATVIAGILPARWLPKLRLLLLRKQQRLSLADFNRVVAAFDPQYYLATYPELAMLRCPLVEHYLRDGWKEGRNPSTAFNTAYYLEGNADIATAAINPFVHWILHGKTELRNAVPHMARLSANQYSPLVTCVVPNFNHAAFLRERIDSVLAQTYSNIEIIILDDNSQDGSQKLIAEYVHRHPERIRAHFSEHGSGSVFKQWKNGMELATGQITWICESDDFCEPDFLANLVPFFSDRSVQLAFGRVQFCDETGVPYPGLDAYRESAEAGIWTEDVVRPACRWFKGAFGVRNIVPNVGGCVWRTQALSADVWRTAGSFEVVGDWYLYSQLAGGGQIAWSPNAVSYFRQHASNTSVSAFRSASFYREHQQVMLSLLQQWGPEQNTVETFIERLKDHYVALECDQRLGSLQDHINVEALLSEKRVTKHILIAFLGFHPGGGEFFPIRLANSLHALGLRVSLMALDMGRVNRSMLESLSAGIAVYDAAYVSEYGVDSFIQDAGVSLIHSHMISVEWYFFEKERMRTQVPYVVTTHGSYESSPLDAEMIRRFTARVDRWVYLADKNLAPLQMAHVPSERCVKLPNAVPVDEQSFPKTRAQLGIEEGAVVFTLVARGIEHKGWHAAILAFKRLLKEAESPRIHLLLAGEGPFKDRMEREYKHCAGIHFLGFQSCIQGLFRLSDVAIVPTRFKGESFPLCILEAFLAAIPVIATDIGQVSEMLRPEGMPPGGIVIPNSRNTDHFVDHLCTAMATLMNPEHRRPLAEGAKWLGKQYDMTTLAQRYIEVYDTAHLEPRGVGHDRVV